MKKYIMAIDAGTTSNRCILFDKNAQIVKSVQCEFEQIYPKPGWVEHDAEVIYSTIFEMIKNIDMKEVEAIGITNQRETAVVWDKNTGKPIYNAIVWQCRRTADMCEKLSDKRDMFQNKTGLIIDAYFSATKIKWILDNVYGAKEKADRGELLFGTIDTWIIWNLTGGKVHATDYTNASRTMLFNIHTLEWDDEILGLFDIPKSMLPEVRKSCDFYGETEEGVPIMGVAGDQQSALFGHRCFNKGEAKNTYGTGCFLLMNTGMDAVLSKHGLLTTIACGEGGEVNYALEGSVFMGGAIIQWIRDELGMISNSAESEIKAKSVGDTNGCYIVPAFTGLGAPYWNPYVRGMITGLTRGVNKNHIIRASLEAIAYQVNDVIKAMEKDSGISMSSLRVDGGACANNFLMQFQADITDTLVEREECLEATALGAAYLAAINTGFFDDRDDVEKKMIFKSDMDADKRDKLIRGWNEAVCKCLK